MSRSHVVPILVWTSCVNLVPKQNARFVCQYVFESIVGWSRQITLSMSVLFRYSYARAHSFLQQNVCTTDKLAVFHEKTTRATSRGHSCDEVLGLISLHKRMLQTAVRTLERTPKPRARPVTFKQKQQAFFRRAVTCIPLRALRVSRRKGPWQTPLVSEGSHVFCHKQRVFPAGLFTHSSVRDQLATRAICVKAFSCSKHRVRGFRGSARRAL